MLLICRRWGERRAAWLTASLNDQGNLWHQANSLMEQEGLTRRKSSVPAAASEPDGAGGVVGMAHKRVQRRRSWEAIIVAVTCFIVVRIAIKVYIRYDLLGIGLKLRA